MSGDESDEDFVKEIVETFLQECQELKEAIHDALQAKDIEALKAAAHGLKGSAAILGVQQLSDEAKDLEYAIKLDKLDDWTKLGEMAARVIEKIENQDIEALTTAAAALC